MTTLPEAPGAKGARICGILAIVFALTCVGIPIAVVLGIVALVLNAKARRIEREQPEAHRRSSAAGLILGIVGLALSLIMLPMTGIVSAIAIPALLAQRTQARQKVCKATLYAQAEALQSEFLRLQDTGIDQRAMLAALKAKLAACGTRNPYAPGEQAFDPEIHMIEVTSEDEMQYQLEPLAKTKGRVVFAISFPPAPNQPGYLGGAVLTEAGVSFQVLELK